jgi:hypothetical protein
MIALSTKEILMGLYSSLGPIDPQVSGAAAHAILEEFREIKATYARTPKEAAAWVPILNKYTPTLIGNCEKAIKLAESIVGTWLETNMFAGEKDRRLTPAAAIIENQIGMRFVNFVAMPQTPQFVLGPQPIQTG